MDGRRALVVAEGRPAAGVTLERALEWACAGSASQDLLLGPGATTGLLPGLPHASVALSRLGVAELVQAPLDAERVLAAIDEGDHDLAVVAADVDDLGASPWIDEVFVRSRRAVVAALGISRGPGTRHRPRLELVHP
jgi:hypothetical protein